MGFGVGRTALRVAVLSLLSASLAGCVAFGDITPHVNEIDQSVGSSLNQAILLNIIRASRNEPLYFTSISQVSGSGNADLKTGLPNIVVGATAPSTLTFTNAADNSESTNFQVGVLNSSDFYRGLLTPIDLAEANLLIHQGFSREMVFAVLVEKGRIHTGDTVREIRNDPADPTFDEFKKDLDLAIAAGMTVETFRQPNPDAPAGGKGSGAGSQSSTPAFVTVGKPCFDQALAATDHFADLARHVRLPPAVMAGSKHRRTRAGFRNWSSPSTASWNPLRSCCARPMRFSSISAKCSPTIRR